MDGSRCRCEGRSRSPRRVLLWRAGSRGGLYQRGSRAPWRRGFAVAIAATWHNCGGAEGGRRDCVRSARQTAEERPGACGTPRRSDRCPKEIMSTTVDELAKRPGARTEADEQGPAKKVLIADDDDAICQLLSDVLR